MADQQEAMATLTIPADLAEQIERDASRDGTSVEELLRRLLRQGYAERLRKVFERADEYNKTLPPTPYTEEDVPRLVKEVRRELWAERQKQNR